jgi:hypothetical protein
MPVTIEADDPAARIAPGRAAGDEGEAVRSVELALHVEFPSVPMEQVTTLVECLWVHFDHAPVRDFVPLLVQKQAREELRDHLGRAGGTTSRTGARPRP